MTRDDAMATLTAPGMPFEIRTEPVRGHDLEVFAHRQRSLGELLRASRAHGDTEYLVTEEARITFAEHARDVAALAAALREDYGVRKGDRVALCGRNSPEWIIAFWATVSLGAVAVGMNSMWAEQEMSYGLDLTEPTVLFADAPRRALCGAPGVPVVAFETGVAEAIARHRGAALPDEAVDEDDPAVVLFTSGTTGRPKGATHSHRNMIAAVWFHLLNDAVATELGRPPSGRRFLLATPLFHIAGLHNLAVVRLVVGDTAVLHTGKFEPDAVLRLIEKERVTNWGAVPTMLSRILDADLSGYDLTSLRTVTVNSAPSSGALRDKLRAALPDAAASLGTSYGLTESSTAATLASPAEALADPTGVGRPIPTMRVEVRDTAGRRVPDGVEGEICLHGVHVMLGYWRNPEATAESTTSDGWFRTGDLGTMRDGLLSISARRSDLVIRGGENVYPAEVENQILLHDAVSECAVVGVASEDLGQEVAAVVVTRVGTMLTENDLREHLRPRLARYKVPTVWRITSDPLPRNATGKVKRAELSVR
ncbi:AMP-binding protein [Rhodococcus sp. HNM0569]|uniref:class I adenylate-forming enzyme family protein n=1 Tax=Rhodococcus sp. HNM0569 TaxID=2716340 RepID=UPI003211D444